MSLKSKDRARTILGVLSIALLGLPAMVFAGEASSGRIQTVAGMPPVIVPNNLYSETRSDRVIPAVAKHLPRVYVPNRQSNDVAVIDPATFKIIDRFAVGIHPQHVVPSWDLRTLWVNNNAEGRTDGSVTPIDPMTGKSGKAIPVDDPYNMYFMPDGSAAIIVAEALKRLDLRDPQTMVLKSSISTPGCAGINHADFSIDGRYAIFTCEFAGTLAKIDLVERKVIAYLKLSRGGASGDAVASSGPKPQPASASRGTGMPQDVRISPDGKVFYVADMRAGGVYLIDGDRFAEVGFLKTGIGAHGLYPSRDGTKLYVANRGSNRVYGPPRGNGSVTVIDFATSSIVTTWPITGGGSPDMGNVSIDGKTLWLSGRFDDAVYVVDTTSGAIKTIPAVGREPHGLTVWPQPGRYSLGHTGNLR
jgi:YVTN family beta-propeller protein